MSNAYYIVHAFKSWNQIKRNIFERPLSRNRFILMALQLEC